MKTINIIGFGNVAQHLANALMKLPQYKIKQIAVRKLSNIDIAHRDTYNFVTINELEPADITLISVTDGAIEQVSNQIPYANELVVHTSGTTAMEILNSKNRKGVFYPLQTFSKNKELNFKEVPLCLETENGADLESLKDLAQLLSNNVFEISSEQRKSLHVAAVFVSNFTNHMYTIGSEVCKANNIPFDILQPLIAETADKIKYLSPKDAQTGPAIRFDTNTIQKHEEFLTNNNYKNLYKLITESIQNV
mgnify:FL=1